MVLSLILQYYEEEDLADDLNVVLLSLLNEGPRRLPYSRHPNIDRDQKSGHERLMKDYFVANPVYPAHLFWRRFRMNKSLFLRIKDVVVANNKYFVQRPNATGNQGLSDIQKVTVAIRMLGYGCAADSLDEYLRLAESTSLLYLSEFCATVIYVFGPEYLRSPTPADTERILKHSANRGFPGMMGSLDCMHWDWKNCPYDWQGAFQNRKGTKSIILEAVATYDLWIWHAFVGMPGSMNDLNVLECSHLFRDLLDGCSPKATFKVNGVTFDQTYYLTDGIYPSWPVLLKAFSGPLEQKKMYFTKMQEAEQKAVKRAFGVLCGRWGILRYPSRLWHRSQLHDIVMCCIILHNMIVEDEHDMSWSASSGMMLRVQMWCLGLGSPMEQVGVVDFPNM